VFELRASLGCRPALEHEMSKDWVSAAAWPPPSPGSRFVCVLADIVRARKHTLYSCYRFRRFLWT